MNPDDYVKDFWKVFSLVFLGALMMSTANAWEMRDFITWDSGDVNCPNSYCEAFINVTNPTAIDIPISNENFNFTFDKEGVTHKFYRWNSGWQEFDPVGKTLTAGSDHYFKLAVTKPPMLNVKWNLSVHNYVLDPAFVGGFDWYRDLNITNPASYTQYENQSLVRLNLSAYDLSARNDSDYDDVRVYCNMSGSWVEQFIQVVLNSTTGNFNNDNELLFLTPTNISSGASIDNSSASYCQLYYGNSTLTASAYPDIISVNAVGDDTITTDGIFTYGYEAQVNMDGGALIELSLDNGTDLVVNANFGAGCTLYDNGNGNVFHGNEADDTCTQLYDGYLEAAYLCEPGEDSNEDGDIDAGETYCYYQFRPNDIRTYIYSEAGNVWMTTAYFDDTVDGTTYYDSTSTAIDAYFQTTNDYIATAWTTTEELYHLWDDGISADHNDARVDYDATYMNYRIGEIAGPTRTLDSGDYLDLDLMVEGASANLTTSGIQWGNINLNPLTVTLGGEANASNASSSASNATNSTVDLDACDFNGITETSRQTLNTNNVLLTWNFSVYNGTDMLLCYRNQTVFCPYGAANGWCNQPEWVNYLIMAGILILLVLLFKGKLRRWFR